MFFSSSQKTSNTDDQYRPALAKPYTPMPAAGPRDLAAVRVLQKKLGTSPGRSQEGNALWQAAALDLFRGGFSCDSLRRESKKRATRETANSRRDGMAPSR